MEQSLLDGWRKATGDLPWGVQRAFVDALTLVKDEKIHLVHGANYRDGKPCLVNAVAQMVTKKDSGVSPTEFAPSVVRLFDRINSALEDDGVNDAAGEHAGYVSSLAAEILLRNFGPLKTVEAAEQAPPVKEEKPYVERSDEDLAREWLASMNAPAPEAVDDLATIGDPVALHLKGLMQNNDAS